MAKDKKGSKAAVPASVSKPIESVKAGRVTKPVESAKSAAKNVAKKIEKTTNGKKSKREETPSESEDASISDSSASSEEDSDSEVEEGSKAKSNGTTKKMAVDDDDSSDASESDSEDEEVAAPAKAVKTNGKTNGVAKADDDDSSEASSSDDDEEAVPKTNGKAAQASSDASDDSESDSDSGSDEDDDAKAGANGQAGDESSDASSSDEEDVKTDEPATKKRKAEDAIAQTPKKTKVSVNGEQKDVTANLFVGNLSFNVDEEWLSREFEEFGQLKGVRVITDRESGRSKGYGYVEFEETASGLAAFEAKNGAELDGRPLRVDFSNPRPERGAGQTPQQRSSERATRYGDVPKEPSANLFVGNLSFNADESAVTEVFEEYGSIKGIRLITDKETGDFKGFGYVEMSSIEEATAAFESLQGAEVAGRPIRLDYASARPTNDSGGRGGFGGGRGRGGFNDRGRGGFGDRGGRGRGRGGFNDRGRGRGGFNRGGFGDFSGKKTTF